MRQPLENWKHLNPDIDRLSSDRVEKHTEAAIAFILAAVKKDPRTGDD